MGYKILLVEDDEFLSDIYSTKFRNAGFEVDVAKDGASGLQKVREEKPNAVLLDIVMPRMDGFEVLHSIRQISDLAGVKVVMLSNLGQQEDVEKGMKLGADAYIIKAHNTPTEVVAKVKELLNASARG
ncbi:MAG: response regulator [Candidatus Spechtbacteria bacterium]|nr:response regulator [Candidatus Spechtbacteria bacterium]